jgi:glucose-1-phosphatase
VIRAAVFDLGGVLEIVDDDRWQHQWMLRWETIAGVAHGTLRASPYLGPTEADFRERVAGALMIADLDTAIAEWWDAYCGELDVELRDFAASLTPELVVAALSNSADGARREELRRYDFQNLFDHMIYSHEVGVEKPDPEIYSLTEKLLEVDPAEIVFLDDRIAAVDGARAAGWYAVLHESTPSSIAAIRGIIEAAR